MKHDDVSDGEMPHLPFARHGCVRHGGEPVPTDALLGAGGAVPDEWQAVSEVLQAAAGPAAASEFAGEAAMVAAFRRAQPGAARGAVPALRRILVRPAMLTTLLSGKLAATIAAAAVSAVGVSTAAYAGALPDGAQNLAHHLIAAPPAHSNASDTGRAHGNQFDTTSSSDRSEADSASSDDTTSSSSTGTPAETMDATETTAGPTGDMHAAFGLCTAWSNAVAHGLTGQVGFKDKLAALAGVGAGDSADPNTDPTGTQSADPSDAIATFCATVQHPGSQPSETVAPMEKPNPGDLDGVKPLHPSKVTGPDGQHGKSGQSHGSNGQGDS